MILYELSQRKKPIFKLFENDVNKIKSIVLEKGLYLIELI